jgi:hypothetical protein
LEGSTVRTLLVDDYADWRRFEALPIEKPGGGTKLSFILMMLISWLDSRVLLKMR